MATDQQLPQNHPDFILAQKLGAKLKKRTSFAELNDPFINQLSIYKETELSSYSISTTVSNAMWNQISEQTIRRNANVTPLFTRTTTFAWASAAVLLIAAILGFYWISMQPQLELVAQSESTIKYVTLNDGSQVILRPNSKLFVDNSAKNRSYSIEGEAFFDVVSNSTQPFTVDAIYGTVTVLGTRFNVSTWGDKALVYLEEGRVAFASNYSDDELILAPGQASEASTMALSILANSNADTFTDWQQKNLIFERSSPLDVTIEISQHFGVRINIDQLQDRSEISGTLRLNSISQSLDDIGLVLGGTFRMINANEYEFIQMD